MMTNHWIAGVSPIFREPHILIYIYVCVPENNMLTGIFDTACTICSKIPIPQGSNCDTWEDLTFGSSAGTACIDLEHIDICLIIDEC